MIIQSIIGSSRELSIKDTDLPMFPVTQYAVLFQKYEKQ